MNAIKYDADILIYLFNMEKSVFASGFSAKMKRNKIKGLKTKRRGKKIEREREKWNVKTEEK